jgi:hypothetical protein
MQPEEYRKLEQRWIDIWDSIQPEGRWQFPWMTTTYANGEPMMDFNPIFSVVCNDLKRAIRVIEYHGEESTLQEEFEGEQVELSWWLDTFGDSEYDDPVINELVIDLRWTPAAGRLAAEMMAVWTKTGKIPDKYNKYG